MHFKKALLPIFLFLLVGLIFYPVLVGKFLHTDDYFWSYWGGFKCSGVIQWMLPVGRPLGGLVYCGVALVNQFSLLALFRGISVLNIGLIACLLMRWMRISGVDTSISFLLSLLVVTLPAYQVYSAYISTLPHCLSISFSLLALLFSWKGWQRKSNGWFWLSGFLVTCALSLNQVGALFYLGALAIPIFVTSSDKFLSVWPKRLKKLVIPFFCAMGVYYLFFRISGLVFTLRDAGKHDARNFVKDIPEQLRWFFQGPLYETSNLWSILPNHKWMWLTSLCVLIFLLGDLIEHRKSWFSAISKSLILILFIPMSFGISLASSAPSSEYRTYCVLGALWIFFLFLNGHLLLVRKWERAGRRLSILILTAFAGSAGYIAHQNVLNYFVRPDSAEFHFVRTEILKALEKEQTLNHIHLFIPSGHSLVGMPQHEFGEPSLKHRPNIAPLVKSALAGIKIPNKPKISINFGLDDKIWQEIIYDCKTIEVDHRLRWGEEVRSESGTLVIDTLKLFGTPHLEVSFERLFYQSATS